LYNVIIANPLQHTYKETEPPDMTEEQPAQPPPAPECSTGGEPPPPTPPPSDALESTGPLETTPPAGLGAPGAFSTDVTVGSLTGEAGIGVAVIQGTLIIGAGVGGYAAGRGLDNLSGGRLSGGAASLLRPFTDIYYGN